MDTVGLSSERSIVTTLSYSASSSASNTAGSLSNLPFTYSMVLSSTGKIPFFPPASIAMLEMVNLSSMLSSATPSPVNSRDLYRAPSTPISPIRCRITSLPDTNGCSLPFSSTLIAGGTLNQLSPDAIPAAMSVEPTPVENAPSAP